MSAVPSTAEPAAVAEQQPARPGTTAQRVILCCYLLGALVVTWRLWADPAGREPVGNPHDIDQFAWYMRYAATAIRHGRLPALITRALNPPAGVNLMWNTACLLPGIALTPVTLLAGPLTSLAVVVTLGLAGSAAALFWVLRRWEASVPAAALGGAVYGFSPALINSGIGHYNLMFAVLPPLMVDALLRILTDRGRLLWAGAWLGLLVSAQLFIGEELLVDTTLACLITVIAVTVQQPRAALRRARSVALGLATAAAVMLVLCGHALWIQFHGPLSEHASLQGPWTGNPGYFVDPGGNVLIHTPAGAAAVAGFRYGPAEVLAYLGWPLLAVLAFCAVRFWRDLRIRTAVVIFVVLELCSLGGGSQPDVPGEFLPWHWLVYLPTLAQVLPNRLAILADGAAAVVLALSLDLARSAAQARVQTQDRTQDKARARGGWTSRIPAAVAVLAVIPLIPSPYQTAPVAPVPPGWQTVFARLRLAPDASVLVVPIPNVGHTEPMRWQAVTGEPGSLIGGYFLGPAPGTRQPVFDPGPARLTAKRIDWLWAGRRADAPSLAQVRRALDYWRPAAVVADTSQASPIGRILVAVLGRPGLRAGRELVWRL
jgi:hypothetical protein